MNHIERIQKLATRIHNRMKNTVTVSLNQPCIEINKERINKEKQLHAKKRKQRKQTKKPINNEVIRSFNKYPKQ